MQLGQKLTGAARAPLHEFGASDRPAGWQAQASELYLDPASRYVCIYVYIYYMYIYMYVYLHICIHIYIYTDYMMFMCYITYPTRLLANKGLWGTLEGFGQ